MSETLSTNSQAAPYTVDGQPPEQWFSSSPGGGDSDFDDFPDEYFGALQRMQQQNDIAKEVEAQSTAARSAQEEWDAWQKQEAAEAATAAAESPDQSLFNQDPTPSNARSLSVSKKSDATADQQ